MEDIEKGAELGPEVSSNIAESFVKTVKRPLSKESNLKLRNNIKTPSNCKEFVPAKVNNEIWKIIPSQARLRDIQQQQTQQALGTGLSALTMISNTILSRKTELPKDLVASVIKLAMDAANVMGDQTQQLNSIRRLDMKKHLNPEYTGICTAQVNWLQQLYMRKLMKNTLTVIKCQK